MGDPSEDDDDDTAGHDREPGSLAVVKIESPPLPAHAATLAVPG
jgi:hypothetical protein